LFAQVKDPASDTKRIAIVTTGSPALLSCLLLMIVVLVIGPWGEFPINDDWHFAHIAKNFAQHGILAIDLPRSTSIIGQSILAWPVNHFLGFSFFKLRLLTLLCSAVILVEVDYLLRLASVERNIRLVTLCLLVVNPFFLYFSMSFMTENYAHIVALLSVCVWFRGRRTDNIPLLLLAAAIAGYAFWIRQLSALVFPAVLLAEFAVHGRPSTRRQIASRGAALTIWVVIVASFLLWAYFTGNQTKVASNALDRVKSPDPIVLFFQFGIFAFYVTFFVAPFLAALIRRENPSLKALLIPTLLILSAGFAVFFGDTDGSPRSNIHRVFPFLHNVFNQYGVGPVLVTDVYIENSGVRPHAPAFVWIVIEIGLIALSVGWARTWQMLKTARNEIAFFGVGFALLNFLAVGLSFITAIFDRYHYSGIIGFTIALAAVFPQAKWSKLRRASIVWILVVGLFSTLALHDHFRWQTARAELASDAAKLGIPQAQIDAGYEINGWNDIEKIGTSPDCGYEEFWFCGKRPFRIGVTKYPADSVMLSQPIRWWFLPFPPMLLMKRG
jgi:hypothetical protein